MIKVALPFGNDTPEMKRESYRAALAAVDIAPVEDQATLADVSGLLLAGGTDVDPALYGEPRAPETEEPEPARDHWEAALLAEAIDRDLPVLAICRGLQLLNVARGGTLIQHIEGHKRPKQREVHRVLIEPGSRLESILGMHEYVVNSRHHQCAGKIARGVAVTAVSPGDGVVEALELAGRRFVLAVQWHPESRMDGPDRRLFEAFRDALKS